MKKLKTPFHISSLLALSFLWSSCQKESVDQPSVNSVDQASSARLSGLVADDAKLVSKVPTIISSEFLANEKLLASGQISATLNAKPVKPGTGGGGTTDAIAPTVSITSPSSGASVSGVTTVAVSATDNVAVTTVSFSVDGAVKATLSTAPYNFSWDASTVADGTHTLTATAKDAKNNASVSTITVAKNTVIVVPPPTTLPSSALLVTPPVGNQGNEFACTPFAVVYGARSIEQYYRTGASSYSYATNIFSPEYVYSQTKVGDCGSGTSITACLDFMYINGVTTWQTVPFSDVNGCSLTPTSTQISEAANYKITNYSKVLSVDQTAIKQMIASKHAVIAALNIDYNFTNARAGYIWNTIGTGNAPHSAIVVGYDDSKNAYRVQNSWGTGWGDAGYLWVDYAVFASRAGYYSYAIN
jgi:hypothetical protein